MTEGKRMLYRLFYRSLQSPSVTADLDATVQQIIAASINRNREVGLTGLLLTIQGYFVQALEGNVDEVRATYARIAMDPRHRDPHIISQGLVTERLFGGWNMCARTLAPSDKAILDTLESKARVNPRALTPASTRRLLTTVAAIQSRTALSALVA